MAKIKIKGCGYCSKSKGCNIKKEFRNLAGNFDKYTKIESYYMSGLKYTFNRLNEFTLVCPFGDRKYVEHDDVEVTIGIGRYEKITEWECNWNCDYCNRDDCEDGLLKFKNTRYTKYIKLRGKILNLYKNDKWVISIEEKEWKIVEPQLNDDDVKFFEQIANVYDPGQEFYMVILSKEKFIKKP